MERIVIFRLGSLGDTVVALPCFNKILAVYPDAERIALTNFPVSSKAAPIESILGDGGFIQRSIRYPLGLRDPFGLFMLGQRLRRLGARTLVYLNSREDALDAVVRDVAFFKLCGFTKIIGAPLRTDLLKPRVDGRTGEVEREASRLARCMASLGPIDIDDPHQWDLHLTAEECAVAEQFLAGANGRPFLAVNTGGKDFRKDWGEANWTALLAGIARNSVLSLVFVGAQEDWKRAEALRAPWPFFSLNGCGKLSPRQTAAVLSHATLFIGHDSGPMHLAAAVGTRCIGLFGGLNQPRRWHPVGSQHTIFHSPDSVMQILVGDVLQAVGKLP